MADLVPGHIAHAVPGRIRIKVDRYDLTDALSARLRSVLAAMPEVSDVRIQPVTGSITVYSGARRLDPSTLANRLVELELIAVDPFTGDRYAGISPPMSETARTIKSTFHGVDVRLGEITRGRWDLRTVVPFALGALAVRAFLAEPAALGAAPWFTLAWYAFDSFWKLNQEHAVVVDPATDETDETDE
jgi:hypothetical protein